MNKDDISIPTVRQSKAPPKGGAEGNLTNAEFTGLSSLIEKYCGIILSDTKKIHVEHKLAKRVRHLGLPSFDAYLKFLATPLGYKQEIFVLMDIVTTNKTDFFREPAHFDFIRSTAVKKMREVRPHKPIRIWSAGCSSGEEPYTLAMVMSEIFQDERADCFSIHATDISHEVLQEAQLGIYEIDRIGDIPLSIKRKYFLKSRDANKQVVRIVPELRKKISFAHLNFIDDVYALPSQMDLIFCRNVIIYFDKQMQERVVRKLTGCLSPGGYLFLGHSETILGMDVPLDRVASTIYRRKDDR